MTVNLKSNHVQLPARTSNPTGVKGDLYYNSSSGSLRYHNGSSWQEFSTPTLNGISAGGVGQVAAYLNTSHNAGSNYSAASINQGSGTWRNLNKAYLSTTYYYNDEAYTILNLAVPSVYVRIS
jgi:hypothetical protein